MRNGELRKLLLATKNSKIIITSEAMSSCYSLLATKNLKNKWQN